MRQPFIGNLLEADYAGKPTQTLRLSLSKSLPLISVCCLQREGQSWAWWSICVISALERQR